MCARVQPATSGGRHGSPALRIAGCLCCCAWSALTDRAMRAPAIEILHVLRQHYPQMALIEDEQVIQTFGPQGSHPALGDRVGLRRPKGSADLGDAKIRQPPIEGRPIPTVTIMDDEARGLAVPAAAFQDLRRYPLASR